MDTNHSCPDLYTYAKLRIIWMAWEFGYHMRLSHPRRTNKRKEGYYHVRLQPNGPRQTTLDGIAQNPKSEPNSGLIAGQRESEKQKMRMGAG